MNRVSTGPCAAKDHTGQRFGRLAVLERAGVRRGYIEWRCRCDCGNECVVTGQNLRRGSTTSCGCHAREATIERSTRHGYTTKDGVPAEYGCWSAMISRCHNPDNASYPRYGARGITVCERWRGGFEFFIEDMGWKPTPAHSLDRIDNDRGYEPGNCRWATDSEQQRNKRNTRTLTVDGETLPIDAWAERSGLRKGCIVHRVYDLGWSARDAVTLPSNRSRRTTRLHTP